jgi:hypothetical protein
VISDGPKFREPQHINWKHRSTINTIFEFVNPTLY